MRIVGLAGRSLTGNPQSGSLLENVDVGAEDGPAWRRAGTTINRGKRMDAAFEHAQWIASTGSACQHPLFRREFTIAHRLRRAQLRINALGYFEAFLNGNRVGDRVLEPGVTNYAKRSFVVEFDVTDGIVQGNNCLGLALGPGWYRKRGPNARFPFPGVIHDGPVVRAELRLEVEACEPLTVSTDPAWKVTPSHLDSLGSGMHGDFGGERFDARALKAGWSTPGYEDTSWTQASRIEVPRHAVTLYEGPPTRILHTWHLAEATPLDDDEGAWRVDAGRELTGWLELDFGTGYAAGHRIDIEYSDRPPDGTFNEYRQRDEYICSGRGPERFRSTFNYHAFRWAVIRGCARPPARATAMLLGADLPEAGHFESGNALLNRIHDLQHWTLRCLTLGGVQVDCPHRERLAYGGDGTASLDSTLYLFNADRLYRNWLLLWRDEQGPRGGLPYTAPSPYPAGGGPVWCGFPITAAWKHFLHYGDIDLLRRHYPAAEKWLDYCALHSDADGLLQPWPKENNRSHWFLGDWLPPDGVDPEHPASVLLIVNCFLVQCRDRMARIAARLGREADARRYAEAAATLRAAIHARFYDADQGVYADGDQVDMAYPLLVGAVPAPLHAKVLRALERLILETTPPRWGTGTVGTLVLLDCLLEAGRNDLLFGMINHQEYPGWGYMLRHGAGTTWEDWHEDRRTHIHNTFNQAGAWFYQGLAGILPREEGPGFRRIMIRPQPVRGIGHVSASHRSSCGPVRVAWEWVNADFLMTVAVPSQSEADVYVPCDAADGVQCDGDHRAPDQTVRLGIYHYSVFKSLRGTHNFRTILNTKKARHD